jgi:hypothetical protein
VTDNSGATTAIPCANCETTINVLQAASAEFECSKDGIVWTTCDLNFKVKVYDQVYLRDGSLPSDGETLNPRSWSGTYVGSGTPIGTWNYSLDPVDKTIAKFRVEKSGKIEILLNITDSAGNSTSMEKTISGGMLYLPQWYEVSK